MYDLRDILISCDAEDKEIRILESTKSYDVCEFINKLEDDSVFTLNVLYYGKVPEMINEDLKQGQSKRKHEYYCPICTVWDSEKLFADNKIECIYPFDPEVVTPCYKEGPKHYKLPGTKDMVLKYLIKFYESNYNYLNEDAIKVEGNESVVTELNELHNADSGNKWTEKKYEPKQTTITLYTRKSELDLQYIDKYKKYIKAIIIPEKILDFPVIKSIPIEIRRIAYKTNPYRAPCYYNQDVEHIYFQLLCGGKENIDD